MTDKQPSDIHHQGALDKLGRRSFVSALLTAGFSITTALGITSEDVKASERDEVPIVVGYSRGAKAENGREIHKKAVPSRWYDQLAKARKVYKKFLDGEHLHKYHVNDDCVVGVWVSSGSVDTQKPYIEIEVTEGTGTPLGYIKSNDVPIKVSSVDPIQTDPHPVDPQTHQRPIIDTQQQVRRPGQTIGNGNGVIGTLGSPVRKSVDGDPYFFTCEHIGGFSPGDNLYTGGSSTSRLIGEIIESDCHDDFAVAEPKNGFTPSWNIVGEIGADITGMYGKDGLADLEAEGRNVKKSGQTTGVTSGMVETHDGTYWVNKFGCIRRTNQLRWGTENDGDSGDSGAPVYTESPSDPNDIWIAASYHATRPDHFFGGDFVHGTSAWAISHDYSYWFS